MRRRLVLAIAGVAGAAVFLFAIPLALVLQRSYRDEELLRLQRDTVAATREIDLSGGGNPVEVPRARDGLAVYDLSGRRIAGRGPSTAGGLAREALRGRRAATSAGDGRLRAAVPLLSSERVTGVVVAQRSDAAVAGRVHRAWLTLAALALAVVGGALMAALFLGRRLAGPLERLAAAARRLGDGDFASRAPRAGVVEVDAVAAALDVTAQRLDDLVTRERSFSADASHQLRTPLAALRLELEAMELGSESADAATALVQVERLQATIDTLLKLARDAPRRDARADLLVLTDEASTRWRAALAARGRPLRTLVEAERHLAVGAPQVVSEILDVLIENAERHGAGAVTVTVADLEGWLSIVVADEGEGFSGDAEEAFKRRPTGGGVHGIGLALARSLATAEGGSLTVSHAGPGPRVRLMLRSAGLTTVSSAAPTVRA